MQMNQVNMIIIQWNNALWKYFSHHIHASHRCVSTYAILLESHGMLLLLQHAHCLQTNTSL